MLDANVDGKVSGVELDDLALWFDQNRNAVSENGEVKRAHDVGIKELFYRDAKTDVVTGNVLLNLGFRREVEGKIVGGKSIDWSSFSPKNEYALYAKNVLGSKLFADTSRDPGNLETQNQNVAKELSSQEVKAILEQMNPMKAAMSLTGMWEWSFDKTYSGIANTALAKVGSDKGGKFVIVEMKDGEIFGKSIVNLPIQTNISAKLKTVVVSKAIAGKINLKDGVKFVEFKLLEKEHADVRSKAKLLEDGFMSGETEALVKSGDQGGTKKHIYRWIAKKIPLR